MNPIRVFLVDDHPLVRHGLVSIPEKEPDMKVVGEAENGRDACERIPALKPDLVIMDLSMPRYDGIKTAERLRRACPEVKILVMTIHREEGEFRQALKAGVNGYLLKTASPEEIRRAIRAVMDGRRYIDSRLTEAIVDRYVGPGTDKTGASGKPTPRELDVLRRIALGYTNQEVAG